MRLTRYTDYSLRVLLFLAVEPARKATIEEIAEAYGISRTHLMKVVRELGRHGLVDTVRGRGGGLRLARAPETIRLGDVVRRTEEDLALVDCFDPEGVPCRIDPACRLRPVLHAALAAFLAVLDETTLADLVERRRRPLARLLEIEPLGAGSRHA